MAGQSGGNFTVASSDEDPNEHSTRLLRRLLRLDGPERPDGVATGVANSSDATARPHIGELCISPTGRWATPVRPERARRFQGRYAS